MGEICDTGRARRWGIVPPGDEKVWLKKRLRWENGLWWWRSTKRTSAQPWGRTVKVILLMEKRGKKRKNVNLRESLYLDDWKFNVVEHIACSVEEPPVSSTTMGFRARIRFLFWFAWFLIDGVNYQDRAITLNNRWMPCLNNLSSLQCCFKPHRKSINQSCVVQKFGCDHVAAGFHFQLFHALSNI